MPVSSPMFQMWEYRPPAEGCHTQNTAPISNAVVASIKNDQEVLAAVPDPLEQNEEIRTVEEKVIQQTNNQVTNEGNRICEANDGQMTCILLIGLKGSGRSRDWFMY
ncbi:hypothetical protein CHS0354_007762 [Potamilus streckersoni]|uniref:Uncharacterized protein n=1 Tax=Potamilus streckersoni TaxID=2493646 RepID=A0AAE0RS47_9BIVA|nr:hypothetical protein CHS0354_007762 [Potamilus streckersoni]